MHSRCSVSPFFLRGAALLLAVGVSPALAETKRHPTPTPAPAKPHGDLTEGLGVTASAPLPEIVAVVNGVSIRRDELEKTFKVLLASNGRNPSELSDEDRKKGYRSVLEEMIADRLLTIEALEEKVDDLDVEKRFDAVKQGFPTPEAFDAELKKTNQTVAQVKANLRSQLRQQKWIEAKIADKVQVAPEEVDKFYKENPDRFNLPEMIRASHILLAVRRDAPPENVLEKETLANTLEDRLKKGEIFEDLAKQYSDDPNAKQTGGDLDYFGRDRIMAEFADAAFKLKVGEISTPVRTQFGFHIIKVTDHKDPRVATLEEARQQVVDYLREAKRRRAVNDLLANLRSNARIDVRLP